MADLNTLIAQGPPRTDFSPLSTLFDSYGAGQKARRQQDIWDARRQAAVTGADGKPDYAATARNLLGAGDIEGARLIAAMVKDMRWGTIGAGANVATDNDAAPAANPTWPKIPMAAAQALKLDPSRREQFDATYGPGASALVLRWGP